MSTETTLITAEEFRRLANLEGKYELVRGEVVEMNRPGWEHSYVCNKVGRIVGNFAEQHGLGRAVSNDGGIVTERNPDTVRGPDVAYFSFARLPAEERPTGYPIVLPEVVFEVLSPDDRTVRVLRKVNEYLEAGVSCVVLLDPQDRDIAIHRPGGGHVELSNDDVVVIPEISQDFRILAREFFS